VGAPEGALWYTRHRTLPGNPGGSFRRSPPPVAKESFPPNGGNSFRRKRPNQVPLGSWRRPRYPLLGGSVSEGSRGSVSVHSIARSPKVSWVRSCRTTGTPTRTPDGTRRVPRPEGAKRRGGPGGRLAPQLKDNLLPLWRHHTISITTALVLFRACLFVCCCSYICLRLRRLCLQWISLRSILTFAPSLPTITMPFSLNCFAPMTLTEALSRPLTLNTNTAKP